LWKIKDYAACIKNAVNIAVAYVNAGLKKFNTGKCKTVLIFKYNACVNV
jgi:hypothetical protein